MYSKPPVAFCRSHSSTCLVQRTPEPPTVAICKAFASYSLSGVGVGAHWSPHVVSMCIMLTLLIWVFFLCIALMSLIWLAFTVCVCARGVCSFSPSSLYPPLLSIPSLSISPLSLFPPLSLSPLSLFPPLSLPPLSLSPSLSSPSVSPSLSLALSLSLPQSLSQSLSLSLTRGDQLLMIKSTDPHSADGR